MAKAVRSSIPADVSRELARFPDLTFDAREAILAAVEGLTPFVSLNLAGEVLGLSRRSIARRLVSGGSFKLGASDKAATRLPRALIVRWLAEGAR